MRVEIIKGCKSVDSSLKDICGNTALYLAIVEDNKDVVELLLKESSKNNNCLFVNV